MLTTLQLVRTVPGMCNTSAMSDDFLNMLVWAADTAIKVYCKQRLELCAVTEYHSGNLDRDIVLREKPAWMGNTTVSSLSSGLALPQSTIHVTSTRGFDPGPYDSGSLALPAIAVQTGINTFCTINYMAATATTFTGCTGGTGTLTSQPGQNQVFAPCVYCNSQGYYGQGNVANLGSVGFTDQDLMILGGNFVVQIDRGGAIPNQLRSGRALLRRIGGGPAQGSFGYFPDSAYAGKLGGCRPPVWPRGDGNLKVTYSCGYRPIPLDLQYACTALVVCMARDLPQGQPLASESLGGYSYSLLSSTPGNVELDRIQAILSHYRESSWGLF